MNRYIYRHEPFGTLIYDINTNEIIVNKELSEFSNGTVRVIKNENKNIPISFPTTVFMEVTKRCNSSCNHCFNNSGNNLQDEELTFKQWCSIIDDLYQNGIFNVKVTGGEPFCRKDIYEIFDYLEAKDINFIIYTNGKAIDNGDLKKLKKYERLLCVRVSLDGTQVTNDEIRGKGAYEAAMNAIKKLSSTSIRCEINFTVSKTNYNQLLYIARILESEKINCKINIGMIKISGRASNNSRYIFEESEIRKALLAVKEQINNSSYFAPYKLLQPAYLELFGNQFGCPAGRLTATINYKGHIFACGLFSEYSNFSCGNALENEMSLIWSSDSMSYIRNLPERYECLCCDIYKSKCTGACRGNALNYYGDICGKDINCEVYKINF